MTTLPARPLPLFGLALLVACGNEPPAETEGAPETSAPAAGASAAAASVVIVEPPTAPRSPARL